MCVCECVCVHMFVCICVCMCVCVCVHDHVSKHEYVHEYVAGCRMCFQNISCLLADVNTMPPICLSRIMGNDGTQLTSWATGTSDIWPQLQKGFKHLSMEYNTLSDKSTQSV